MEEFKKFFKKMPEIFFLILGKLLKTDEKSQKKNSRIYRIFQSVENFKKKKNPDQFHEFSEFFEFQIFQKMLTSIFLAALYMVLSRNSFILLVGSDDFSNFDMYPGALAIRRRAARHWNDESLIDLIR